jgi:hypothetical protein
MEIKVNDIQWNNLTEAERDNISQIMTGYFKEAALVPDSATPVMDLNQMTTQLFGLTNPFCKAACDIAQAAAMAACTTVGGPVAVAACTALAQAAGDACRNAC